MHVSEFTSCTFKKSEIPCNVKGKVQASRRAGAAEEVAASGGIFRGPGESRADLQPSRGHDLVYSNSKLVRIFSNF